MERILSCFERCFSKRQFTSFLFILHFLLASERKQLSCAEGKSESAFSRFLGIYPWDPEAVEEARIQEHWDQVEGYVREYHIGRLTLRLILDDTVVPKSGTAFDRLGVHYSSTLEAVLKPLSRGKSLNQQVDHGNLNHGFAVARQDFIIF